MLQNDSFINQVSITLLQCRFQFSTYIIYKIIVLKLVAIIDTIKVSIKVDINNILQQYYIINCSNNKSNNLYNYYSDNYSNNFCKNLSNIYSYNFGT